MKRLPVLITDSCVLIDFAKTARDALERLCACTQVNVPRILLREEVADLTEPDAVSLGLTIVDAPLAMVEKAGSSPGPLSFHDWLCVLMASENRWTCVSNDKRLRATCRERGVKTLWSLETLILLVSDAGLARDRAAKIARAMTDINPFIGERVLEDFTRRLAKLG